MKLVVFSLDTYIESVIAFCKTVDVVDVCWYTEWVEITYR